MGVADSLVEKVLLEKAVIEILDLSMRDAEIRIHDCIDAKGSCKSSMEIKSNLAEYKALEVKNVLQKESSKANEKLKRAAQAFAGMALTSADIPDHVKYAGTNATIRGAVRRRFKVQFNPTTLSVSGYGGGMVQKTVFSQEKDNSGGTTYEEASPHIELSVQLIFDNSNHLTAFPGDLYGLNVGTATGAAEAGVKAAGEKLAEKSSTVGKLFGKRPSIQEEVEGFLALLRNKYTRAVSFIWGSMAYVGICNSVGAKYTMFNPSGEPIRATINFRMVCADESVTSGQMGYWEDMFENFSEDTTTYQSYENNWLNLKG